MFLDEILHKEKLLDEAEAIVDSQLDTLIESRPDLAGPPRDIVKLTLLAVMTQLPGLPPSTVSLFEQLQARILARQGALRAVTDLQGAYEWFIKLTDKE